MAGLAFMVTLGVFVLVLFVMAISSCEVRERSAKRACRDGAVQRCLEVAKFYQEKGADKGLLAFAMGDDDEALVFYLQGCKLKSSAGCDGVVQMDANGQSARNTVEKEAIVDVLIDACSARVEHGCEDLETYWSEYDPRIAERSALAFKKGCDGGNAWACHLVGTMARKHQGGLHDDPAQVLAAYDRACEAPLEVSCAEAKAYRASTAPDAGP